MADYAFIVGIENYIQNSLPQVRYAEADAQAVAGALQELGFTIDSLLLSASATKTNIEHKLSALFDTLTKTDRFLFYYAGHGFASVGHTVLSSAETTTKAVEMTGVSLKWIMDKLNDTACTKWMFFLDCCHSGEINLHDERSVIDGMSDKEIKEFFHRADHKVCFASCKFSQKSYSATAIKHGIWTNQLLKALKGEEAAALSNGKYLTANSLQDFLHETVQLEAKKLLSPDAKQTPVIYGAFTNNFQIADLSALLTARKAASPENESFRDAEYVQSETQAVKSLPGFNKARGHRVPNSVDSYTRGFVERCAEPLVTERTKARYTEIRDYFGLLRKEITQDGNRVVTKDFEYQVWAEQDEENPGNAIIFEMLSGVSPEVLEEQKLNEFFSKSFDEMRLSLPKKISVVDVIDRIQALRISEIGVEYGPDCESCEIKVAGGAVRVQVTQTTITALSSKKTSPKGLLDALKDFQGKVAQLAGPVPFLLR